MNGKSYNLVRTQPNIQSTLHRGIISSNVKNTQKHISN